MAEEAFLAAMEALDEQYNESDMANHVKERFEAQYGGLWHCFVGRNFGAFVTHEEKKIIYFYIQQTGFLLFGTVWVSIDLVSILCWGVLRRYSAAPNGRVHALGFHLNSRKVSLHAMLSFMLWTSERSVNHRLQEWTCSWSLVFDVFRSMKSAKSHSRST